MCLNIATEKKPAITDRRLTEDERAYTDGNKRIMTPRDLLEYDPTVYDLLAKVYPDHQIPTDVCYAKDSATPSDTAARSGSV